MATPKEIEQAKARKKLNDARQSTQQRRASNQQQKQVNERFRQPTLVNPDRGVRGTGGFRQAEFEAQQRANDPRLQRTEEQIKEGAPSLSDVGIFGYNDQRIDTRGTFGQEGIDPYRFINPNSPDFRPSPSDIAGQRPDPFGVQDIFSRSPQGRPRESTFSDPRSGAQGRAGSTGFNPQNFSQANGSGFNFSPNVGRSSTQRRGTTTRSDAQVNLQEQRNFIENLRQQTPEQRAEGAGLSRDAIGLGSRLAAAGTSIDDLRGRGIGTTNGRISLISPDEETVNKLIEQGIIEERNVQRDSQGNILNATTNISEDEFNQAQQFEQFVQGQDISQAEQGLSQLEQEQADIQEQNRQEALFRQQQAQEAGQAIERNNDQAATSVGLEQLFSMFDDGTPAGRAVSDMYRQAFQATQGNEAILQQSADLQVGQAQDSYASVKSIIDKGKQRAGALFNDSKSLLEDTRERNIKLLADQKELADNQLLYEREKLVRQERQRLADEIDTRYTSLALAGGFGSSNGLDEVAQARQRGEQAITDLQKEFAFKRTDLLLNYTALVNQAEETYTTNVLNAANNLESRLSQLDLQSVANQQTKDAAIRSAIQNMGNQIVAERRAKAERYKDAANTLQESINEKRKAEFDEVVKTGDTIKFTSDLTKEINQNEFISNAREVDTRFRSIKATIEQIEEAEKSGDPQAKNFADQALINLFNKISDPTSVVRESEFARSAQGLPYVQRIDAAFKRVTEGGVLEPDARRELYEAANTLQREYNSQLQRDLQPYIARVNMFNSQNVETPVQLTDVLPSNLIPQVPQATRELWRQKIQGTQASLGGEPAPGFSSNPPAQGFRTDRHNNPTAFTVDIAKQAGLKEGVDYVAGDPFPNNPNQRTAKLLQDPIETTIRVIDKIGFYTQGGNQRWTHTALSESEWNSLTLRQKSQVVYQMYQKEGGTGVLLGESQIASSPTYQQESPLSISTASAAGTEQFMPEPLPITIPALAGRAYGEYVNTSMNLAGKATQSALSSISKFGSEFLQGFQSRQ